MVALSVSISAKISPSSTSSPTFLNQEATVPSSMVSLNLGIVITWTSSFIGFSTVFSESCEYFLGGSESSISLGFSGLFVWFPKIESMSSPGSPIMASGASTFAVSFSFIPI